MITTFKSSFKVSLVLICLLSSILPVSSALNNVDALASLNDVSIIVRSHSNDINEQIVQVSYKTTDGIINELKNSQTRLKNQEISELEYLHEFLSIFQTFGILPSNFSIVFFQRLADQAQGSIHSSHNLNLVQRFDQILYETYEQNNQFDRAINPSIHIGRGTIIGSVSFGNYLVKRIIPFKPYGFHEVFSKKLFLDYNLSSVFSYASACIWTPGPRGHHVLYSFYPYPGLQSFSKNVFVDKAIGGMYLLGAHISLEAFSNDGKNILFDATIGVYGADLMIGFGR
ncbi:MAG: hypothetical protein QCH96_01290 [Candidatus Thermoplasmatota archaeon]|nr:hypothetical protein [Candidatus Thermoplasmatota archaeon]